MKIDLIYMALGWRKKRLDIGVFVKFVGMFDISANQFIHSDSGNQESQRNGGFRVRASPNPASDQHGSKSQHRFAPYISLRL